MLGSDVVQTHRCVLSLPKIKKTTQADGRKTKQTLLQTETNIGVAALIHFLSYSAIYEDRSAQTGAREKNQSAPR